MFKLGIEGLTGTLSGADGRLIYRAADKGSNSALQDKL
jgi:hypothetical protein